MQTITEAHSAEAPQARTASQSVASKIGEGTFFGALASATQVGTRLVTVPIVILHLGLGGYGIWAIIMATVAYMRFGTAGAKSAFQKYVAESTATGQFGKASQLVSTGAICILLLSVIGLIPIAIYSDSLAVASGVPPEFLSAASRSITILAAILVMANFGGAFEAIVMGAQRIDLTRKFNICMTTCEAIAIIMVLHLGYGLVAMSIVMASSELIYIFACYVASSRILPEVEVRLANFRAAVLPELLRFAGSFQLVNILEVLYTAILPIFILKYFGAENAGIFAVATRVASSAVIAQDAFSLSILSGGSLVFALGSLDRMRNFLRGSFRAMLILTLPPLAFVAAFGPTLVLAWTGQTEASFRIVIILVCLACLLKGLSLLQLVLYRSSGRALLDNIRQILRIVILLIAVWLGKRIGFYGVLGGCAVAELGGVIFMFLAMEMTFKAFSVRTILADGFRVLAATALIVGAGIILVELPINWAVAGRTRAVIQLCESGIACLLVTVPALLVTKTASLRETRLMLQTMLPWRRSETC